MYFVLDAYFYIVYRDLATALILSTFLHGLKAADIRKHNMERIELALKKGGSFKAVKKRLGIGKNQTYALRGKLANVIMNRDEMVIVAEEFNKAAISRIILNEEVVQKR